MLIFFNKKKHVSILSYEKFKMCRMVLYFKIDKIVLDYQTKSLIILLSESKTDFKVQK